jgi:uncharacterized membrane protein
MLFQNGLNYMTSSTNSLRGLLVQFEQSGAYTFILPLLLLFGIFYVVLLKMPFWKENPQKDKLSIVIAIVLSAIVVIPFAMNPNLNSESPIAAMLKMSQSTTVIVIMFFLFLMIAGTIDAKLGRSKFNTGVLLIIFMLLFWQFASLTGLIKMPDALSMLGRSDVGIVVFVLALVVILIVWATGGVKEKKMVKKGAEDVETSFFGPR